MSKKTFKLKGGFESLLENDSPKTTTGEKKQNNTIQKITIRAEEDKIEQIKDIAYWERKKIADVIRESLEIYIKQYIEKKGSINQRPKE